jgi:hypothetical protein
MRLWEQNLLKQRAQAVSLVGEATVAEFHRYPGFPPWDLEWGW